MRKVSVEEGGMREQLILNEGNDRPTAHALKVVFLQSISQSNIAELFY